jgi:restriction system protein
MKFKMHERSLFASLLRAPWWVSMGLGVAIALVSRITLKGDFLIFGVTMSLPFAVVAVIGLKKQLQAPSPARVAVLLAAVQAMSWREFSVLVEAAFVRDGFAVKKVNLAAADFEIARGLSVVLVSCKRWKAASHGLAPLQELVALREVRGAGEAMYISTGPLTGNAQSHAAEQKVRLVNGAELAQFLRDLVVKIPGTKA